jgi:hypothetical protein
MGMLEPRRPTVDWFCFDDRASSAGTCSNTSSTGTHSYADSDSNTYASAATGTHSYADSNSNTYAQSNTNSNTCSNADSTKRSKNFTSCFLFRPRCYYRKTIW